LKVSEAMGFRWGGKRAGEENDGDGRWAERWRD
jgi:hypothetical protein